MAQAFKLHTERRFQVVDITTQVEDAIDFESGAAHVFCPHTSCGLAFNEFEDGFHVDLEAVLEEIASTERPWVHDDLERRTQNIEPDERPNGWSHVRALLATTPFLLLPVAGGKLAVGQWQRALLVELDG